MQRIEIQIPDVLFEEMQTAVASIRQPGYAAAAFAREVVENELASRRLRTIAPAAYGARIAPVEEPGYHIAWPTKSATFE